MIPASSHPNCQSNGWIYMGARNLTTDHDYCEKSEADGKGLSPLGTEVSGHY